MAILRGLNKAIRNIQERRRKQALTITREIFEEVYELTPVDTGALRSHWFLTLNRPSQRKFNRERTDFKDDPNRLGRFRNTQRVFLTNVAPYAGEIEYEGKSRQKAPNGMLRIGIQRVINRNS